ncbi:hypothetical protein CDAR_300171 [Caerostris darwini]|uniref:Ribosomal protein S10 n=1 Tax=Caerostris darwini TaxID=1538125 RepID=A0AAV4W319_9ARAC|nr:hypothetical protein CDAR_300171 [Caerostris darwini]
MMKSMSLLAYYKAAQSNLESVLWKSFKIKAKIIPMKQPINPPLQSFIANSRYCRESVQSKDSSKTAKIIGTERLHPEIPKDTFRRFPENSAIRTPKCVLITFKETDFVN